MQRNGERKDRKRKERESVLELGALVFTTRRYVSIRGAIHTADGGEENANFAFERVNLGMRVIHFGFDPRVQIRVGEGSDRRFAVHLGLLGGTDDSSGNGNADFTDSCDFRVEQASVKLLGCQGC